MERGGVIRPIWLPLIVAVLVVPIVLGAFLGGPSLGFAVALVLLVAIVVVAVRGGRNRPIEAGDPADGVHRVLLAMTVPIGDPATTEEVVRAAEARGDRPTEVLALAPTRPHLLDRWAGDVGESQAEARHTLDVTVASLHQAQVETQAQIGDSDIVQAIEDALRAFPADEVILATGPAEEDRAGSTAARRLEERLRVHFEHVVTPARSLGSDPD